MADTKPILAHTSHTVWCIEQQQLHQTSDLISQERPVSLVYNGVSHIVLMASPSDIEALALGFSLSEGILQRPSQLYGIDIVDTPQGLVVEMDIASEAFVKLKGRRRNLQGRTGCGLCGIESLDALKPVIPKLDNPIHLEPQAIERALEQFSTQQPLRAQTGSVHGAAWATVKGDIHYAVEDVGRHNALDKLIGYGVKHPLPWREGFVLVSSRASYEMVLKSALSGITCLVAVSAPTDYAIALAKEADLTLIGFARPQRQVVYHGIERITVRAN